MNIAVFIKATTFHQGYGGLETQNKSLCEGLAARGHTITVFSPKRDYPEETAELQGVKYVFVPSVYKTLFSSIDRNNWYERSFCKFKEMHEKEKYDLVISQSSAGLGVIRNKEALNIKVVSISHGTTISEFQTRFWNISSIKDALKLIPDTLFTLYNFFRRQRLFIHGSDHIIAVSDYVKKSLVSETYVFDDKITVIHNGVNSYLFSNVVRTNSGDKVRFLYTSQVIKEKGVDILLDIFKDSAFANCEADVIGGGAYLDQFRAKVEKQGLLSKIHVHGKVPFDSLLEYYAGGLSDIYLMPTRRVEGFPMVLVEAMLGSLPVVAFNLGGVGDAVIDGRTGYLIKAFDYPQFKEKLLHLTKDKALRQTFGNFAHLTALKDFTIDTMLNKYEEVFKEVLK